MPASRYQAVLFDLDGTLLDTVPDLAFCSNAMLRELGLPELDEASIASFVGRGIAVLVERCLKAGGRPVPTPGEADAARVIFERWYGQESGRRSKPFPGVEPALRMLYDVGLPMGVVTNKAARFTLDLVRTMGWEPYFGVVVSGDTLPVRKPDPAPVLHACDRLGAMPRDTLMIGDSRHDVEAAVRAGCTAWCVPYGYNEGEPVDGLACERIVADLEVAAQLVLGGRS